MLLLIVVLVCLTDVTMITMADGKSIPPVYNKLREMVCQMMTSAQNQNQNDQLTFEFDIDGDVQESDSEMTFNFYC